MIFVECKPDYTLVSKLLSESNRKVEHSADKAAVLNKLVRRSGFPNYENSFGMIDEDPLSYQPKVIRDFAEKENLLKHKIKILNYRLLNNHVIILCPRLEEWVTDASKEAKISMAAYGLPDKAEQLHQIINLNIDNFEHLVNDLIEKSERVNKLKQCLEGRF
jgi:hypothetical protein